MGIVFHCEYCGKKIQASDNAGGKWGKCPSCHNKLYIPGPGSDDEEFKLAPIDDGEIARQKQLIDETHKLTEEILKAKEIPDDHSGPGTTSKSDAADEQLTTNIIAYLRNMADGDLDQAEGLAKLITPSGKKAAKILNEIALSEIPEPELKDVPKQVLSGLIKNLRIRIQ